MTRDTATASIALEAVQPGVAGVGVYLDDDNNLKRVLVGPVDACGECDVCRRGGAPVCPHATRRGVPSETHVVCAPRWLVALDDGLVIDGAAAAAVAGDVTLAYTLYARANVGPREPVVVTGGSAITRFAIEILVAKGIAPVLVVADPGSPFATWARGKGAATAGASRAQVAEVLAAQGGHSSAAARPWRVIATDHATLPLAFELAGPRATITALARGDSPDFTAAVFAALAREVAITGISGPHPDLVVDAAALVVRGEIDLAGGVTRDPLDSTRTTIVSLS